MDLTVLVFLSSGLFLGWSLGANDAANVFGTAVGSRMVTFTTAAIICSVFIILGAVISGAGAAHGLGKLGTLNALPGAFMAAFSAALTVYWMTRLQLPVSTTQAVVGAIVGWNLFTDSLTDINTLTKIVGTWIAAPILGAIFGALIYAATARLIGWAKIHLISLDAYTRWGLIFAGAFGSYSLGANNIGNVMGVFVSSSPFTDFHVGDLLTITSVQQLFLVGALAIGVGVFTYSKRVMMTVGSSLMPLNPVAAWVVVISHSIVLFLFSSTALEHSLVSAGLPSIPLIPVSSSQAVVGAIIGIGLLKGVKGARIIRWRVLANIASGWVSTPIVAAVICFTLLFFLQNVFNQTVYRDVYYVLSAPVLEHLQESGLPKDELDALSKLKDEQIARGVRFRDAVRQRASLTSREENMVITAAEVYPMRVTAEALVSLDRDFFSSEQHLYVTKLGEQSFQHRWQLAEALAAQTDAWKKRPATRINKLYNVKLQERLDYLYSAFRVFED